MRVAITNPFVWPHVRRGSERLLNDLAAYLHACGMDVDVHAMAPAAADEWRDGVHYRMFEERWRFKRRQFNSLHWFAFGLQEPLRRDPPDVVFCLNYFDAWAALRARRRHGLAYKVVFQSVGIPIRSYFRAVPIDRWFMRTVLREADACVVLSSFAQATLKRDFGVDSCILPPPVFTERFTSHDAASTTSTDTPPTLLYVGDVDEVRKGAAVLCDAFVRLRSEFPGLRLRFCGRASAPRQAELRARMAGAADAAEFLGVGDVDTLPREFRAASVTVLPAVWEAFGLIFVESLAAGTPVVGANHGGIGDVVQGPLVGALFEPGTFRRETMAVDALVDALRGVLLRGKTVEVQAACRARAQHFSWASVGPQYRELIEAVARPRAALAEAVA